MIGRSEDVRSLKTVAGTFLVAGAAGWLIEKARTGSPKKAVQGAKIGFIIVGILTFISLGHKGS